MTQRKAYLVNTSDPALKPKANKFYGNRTEASDASTEKAENSYIQQRYPSPLVGTIDQDTVNCVFSSYIMMLKFKGYIKQSATWEQILAGLYRYPPKKIDSITFVYGYLKLYRNEEDKKVPVKKWGWWGLEDVWLITGGVKELLNKIGLEARWNREIYRWVPKKNKVEKFADMMVNLGYRHVDNEPEGFYFYPQLRYGVKSQYNLVGLLANLRRYSKGVVLKYGTPRFSYHDKNRPNLKAGRMYKVSGRRNRAHHWIIFINEINRGKISIEEYDPIPWILGAGGGISTVNTTWYKYQSEYKIGGVIEMR